ncbi:fasciculation and elongation protein zeta-2 isoform X1 [Corythoichthys intestinalis]|uniref:fasciculation and elongation protein zeta-2 isoform X1 n=1 Tax=Corythoichthys intestinalis TaxID=161448 RepID=UPI0025A51F8F|nr:fasciculation and elongation protein zeta-2 isoform X1 [Corythoichthys intestinalis]
MAAPTAPLDDGWPNTCADRSLKGAVPAAAEKLLLNVLDGGDDDDDEDDGVPRDLPRRTVAPAPAENLMGDFERTLSLCFGVWSPTAANSEALTMITEDTLLQTDEIWNALTKSNGQMTEMDWKHSRARSLLRPAFNPEENMSQSKEVAADVSEVEELREQLDMHSIIVSCLGEEPLFTAEQVIEEIEEMMQDSSDFEAQHNPSQADLSMLSVDVQRPTRSPSYEERLHKLNVVELNEHLEEADGAVKRLSEELVQHLALRDELGFEKEVKNTFISALIDVQNRQKEHREALKKKKKLKAAAMSQSQAEKSLGSRFSMEGLSSVIQNGFRQTFGTGCSERQYLTTIIPYEKKGIPPSIEDLQILIKILHAMRDDSDKVPALLTDYILKVLCPT